MAGDAALLPLVASGCAGCDGPSPGVPAADTQPTSLAQPVAEDRGLLPYGYYIREPLILGAVHK